jgi:hypothetical protein
MQRRTAWAIAHAYAEVVGLEPDAAFDLLIVEDRNAGVILAGTSV